MRKVYIEMRERHAKLVAKRGVFINPDIDAGECIAVYGKLLDGPLHSDTPTTGGFTPDFYTLLRDLEPFGVTYHPANKDPSRGTLHYTIMQLIPADFYKGESPEPYKFLKVPSICIKFKGVILTQTGVVMCGYPDQSIGYLRQDIRNQLSKVRLPNKEPAYSDSAHATVLRFVHPVDITALRRVISKYSETDFGEADCDFEVGLGTWKLNRNEA